MISEYVLIIEITCLLARTKMGTEVKRASPSNDLISLTTTDRFELLLASTTNTNISVSWKNLDQYLLTLSLPPTKNKHISK